MKCLRQYVKQSINRMTKIISIVSNILIYMNVTKKCYLNSFHEKIK